MVVIAAICLVCIVYVVLRKNNFNLFAQKILSKKEDEPIKQVPLISYINNKDAIYQIKNLGGSFYFNGIKILHNETFNVNYHELALFENFPEDCFMIVKITEPQSKVTNECE